MTKLGGCVGVVVVLLASACGPKPRKPNTIVDDPRPNGPLTPPAPPSDTATIHLECTTTMKPQYQDYVIDLVANQVDMCRFSRNRAVTLILEDGAHVADQMQFTIDPYNQPGTYTPTTFSISKGVAGSTHVAEDCSGGSITIVDSAPNQAFPKPMGFVISCPRLKNSDTHTCSPLNLNLRLTCEAS